MVDEVGVVLVIVLLHRSDIDWSSTQDLGRDRLGELEEQVVLGRPGLKGRVELEVVVVETADSDLPSLDHLQILIVLEVQETA